MNYFFIVIFLALGVVFWFFDNLWNLFGKQFLEGFFFAGGLHPGEQYVYIFLISILNIGLIIFSFFKKQNFRISLALIFYFIFCILLGISTFFSSVDTFESLREFWIYTLMFSASLYAYNFVFEQKDKEEFLYNHSLILLTIFIVSILISVIVSLGLPAGSPWMSLFYQKNAFGGFVLLFIPIAFSLTLFSIIYKDYVKSILFFIAFIFGVFSLIFSASKASFISLAICLPLYLAGFRMINFIDWKSINYKTKVLFVVSGSFALLLLTLQFILDKKFTLSLIGSIKSIIFSLTNTVIARVDFWEASLKIANDFLFGCGLYNFSKLYPVYQAGFYYYSKDPHNYYLKLIAETGYISFVFFILPILYYIYKFVSLHKNINFALLSSEEYKNNIAKDTEEMDPNFKQNLSKIGIYILSYGISLGIIQSLIHIAFDVDFKFSYILIVFLLNLYVNLAIIEYLANEKEKNSNKIYLLWVIIFLPISLFTLWYSIREIQTYKVEKIIERSGNYKQYLEAVKNSWPSSSKYVTLAELYRANSNFQETIKCNQKAIKLCKYNLNAYLSIAYLYTDQMENLLQIHTSDKEINQKIVNKINTLSYDTKKIIFEAFKYDNKNYPDLYILLAKSYEYKNSKNYKNLYRHIFTVVYPPQEYINLMDIRFITFGDVIAEAYVRYLLEDFIICQTQKDKKECEKVANYLYEPIIKYKIKTNLEEFYILGAISSYIKAKEIYLNDYKISQEYFLRTKNLLETALYQTKDIAIFYYYTVTHLYLNDVDTALDLAKKIFSIPLDSSIPKEQLQKLKLIKINNYSVLSQIYDKKNLKILSKKYAELYRKYKK
ncbi:MAG: O-antigen ligase family protein [bacterium]